MSFWMTESPRVQVHVVNRSLDPVASAKIFFHGIWYEGDESFSSDDVRAVAFDVWLGDLAPCTEWVMDSAEFKYFPATHGAAQDPDDVQVFPWTDVGKPPGASETWREVPEHDATFGMTGMGFSDRNGIKWTRASRQLTQGDHLKSLAGMIGDIGTPQARPAVGCGDESTS
ncbi:hypothetical protein ACH5AL_15125 [Actinacidiphila glaucinigra]|uniref:hypothetical protein n=1 Tax=Actinacidiphila glaucinigra TaxID=235986 RepID=UPI0037B349F2